MKRKNDVYRVGEYFVKLHTKAWHEGDPRAWTGAVHEARGGGLRMHCAARSGGARGGLGTDYERQLPWHAVSGDPRASR